MTASFSTDWKLIDAAAEKLGVKKEARKAWKKRHNVPHKWRFEIIKQTGGAISMDAFDSIGSEGA